MSRDRDRSPRRDRRSGGGGRSGGAGSNANRAPVERRVFVSNIPFEMKWQEVKDMFRDEVGEVQYVNMFNDENDKPRGCGILEFATAEVAKKAIEKMHKYDLKGRKLVVKEDTDQDRDRCGRLITGRGGDRRDRDGDRDRDRDRGRGMGGGGGGGGGNTYGLSPQFLESLDIDGPLHTRIFIANLSYDVDERKLREVFRLAGRVCSAELNRDKDGKSRGHGVVEYSHPVEAVQAISMFNNQILYDRKMGVRFDKTPGVTPEELDQLPSRLPEGLEGVGMGLGANGNPLTNVAQNLPSIQNQSNATTLNMTAMANLASNLGNIQEMAALARLAGLGGGGGGAGASTGNGMGGDASAMGMGGGGMGMGGGGSAGSQAGGMGGGGMAPMSGGLGGMSGSAGSMSSMGSMGGSMGSGASMGGSMAGAGSSGAAGMGSIPGLGSMSGAGGGGGMAASGMGASGMGGLTGSHRGGIGGSGVGLSSLGPRPGMGSMGGASMASSASSVGSGMPRSDSIIVRNLPPSCTWQALREGFSHCGEIKYAEMKERGTGLVRFNSERDAERAMSMMDKHNIGGQTIEVRLY